jgi:hypothetical protein
MIYSSEKVFSFGRYSLEKVQQI